jgi:hypothetical protein
MPKWRAQGSKPWPSRAGEPVLAAPFPFTSNARQYVPAQKLTCDGNQISMLKTACGVRAGVRGNDACVTRARLARLRCLSWVATRRAAALSASLSNQARVYPCEGHQTWSHSLLRLSRSVMRSMSAMVRSLGRM